MPLAIIVESNILPRAYHDDFHNVCEMTPIFSSKLRSSSYLPLQRVVIDGPSLVFFINNRLTSHVSNTKSGSNVLICLPTYAQIYDGVKSFLEGLEACGGTIKRIFFDGSLPISKRATRLQRLERARVILATQRIAHPELQWTVPYLPYHEISAAIWKKSTTTQQSDLAQPFMVPAIIEQLHKSRWSSVTHVVPGEAESYCAPAARAEDACVLTNDSDLLLYDDLATDTGAVVLLNSVQKQVAATETSDNTIFADCWRPKHIAHQLGLQSLLQLGYARSTQPYSTFLAVRQQAILTGPDNDTFREFALPFERRTPDHDSPLSDALRDIDPRLAEVVSQYHAMYRGHDRNVQIDPERCEIYSTFPVILEDPTRDAAWLYGRTFRSIAYAIITEHYQRDLRSVSQWEGYELQKPTVVEAYRKGQNIAVDHMRSTSDADQHASFGSFLQTWQLYRSVVKDKSLTDAQNLPLLAYWLAGLHTVLMQRQQQGKSLSAKVIMQFLGQSPPEIEKAQKKTKQEKCGDWDLIHVNGCVQAVLYSVRMLLQAVDLVVEQGGSPWEQLSFQEVIQKDSPGRNGALRSLLPTFDVQAVFLHPGEIADSFKQAPPGPRMHMLELFAKSFDLIDAFGFGCSDIGHEQQGDKQQTKSTTDEQPLDRAAGEDTAWETSSRKRKAVTVESRTARADLQKRSPLSRSRPKNIFEVLDNM